MDVVLCSLQFLNVEPPQHHQNKKNKKKTTSITGNKKRNSTSPTQRLNELNKFKTNNNTLFSTSIKPKKQGISWKRSKNNSEDEVEIFSWEKEEEEDHIHHHHNEMEETHHIEAYRPPPQKKIKRALQEIPKSELNRKKLQEDLKDDDDNISTARSASKIQPQSVVPIQAKLISKPKTVPPPETSVARLSIVDPFEHSHRECMQQRALGSETLSKIVRDTPSKDKKGKVAGKFETPVASQRHSLGLDESVIYDCRELRAPFRIEKKKISGAAVLNHSSSVKTSLVLKNPTTDDPQNMKAFQEGSLLLGVGNFGPGLFSIGKFLGGGTYGSVFQVNPCEGKNERYSNTGKSFAMKIEVGVRHLPWELNILRCERTNYK
jgi:hypothetical protein